MTTLTPSRSRALLRRAAALLDGYEDYPLHERWTEARGAFLADVAAALGVSGTEAVLVALETRKRGQRGPDLKKRRRPGEKSLDLSPGAVPVSPLSREDASRPDAGQNDERTTADQIAARDTTPKPHFQPCFP